MELAPCDSACENWWGFWASITRAFFHEWPEECCSQPIAALCACILKMQQNQHLWVTILLTVYRPRHKCKTQQTWSAPAVSVIWENFLSVQSQKWLRDGSDQTISKEDKSTVNCRQAFSDDNAPQSPRLLHTDILGTCIGMQRGRLMQHVLPAYKPQVVC